MHSAGRVQRFKWRTLILVATIALALSQIFGGNGDGYAYASYGDSGSQGSEQLVESAVPAPADDGGAHKQSGAESLAQDLALVAEANEWTVAEAALNRKMADAVGDVAEQVAEQFPDIFVGSAVSRDPAGAPTLYVKGPASPSVRQLVAAAGVEIDLVDRLPYSFVELEERQMRLYEALEGQGFREVVTSFDIAREGQLEAAVRRESGTPQSVDSVIQNLPPDLRGAEVTVTDDALVRYAEAFGGMRVSEFSNASGGTCTSGWSVQRDGSTTTGVTTAGHCFNIDYIHHGGHTHSLVHQREHFGAWGDIEWKTSSTSEPPEFYASSTELRDVEWVEFHSNFSLNEQICVYGRSRNVRDCSARIADLSVQCGGADRLVRMNKEVVVGGDSGGGWSWNQTAYGSTVGNCWGGSVFSVADYYDEALGVHVRTKCSTCASSGGK